MRKTTQYDPAEVEAIRVPQIAKENSCGQSIVWAAIRKGELEAFKLGDYRTSPVVATREAIRRWRESHRYKPAETEPEAA